MITIQVFPSSEVVVPDCLPAQIRIHKTNLTFIGMWLLMLLGKIIVFSFMSILVLLISGTFSNILLSVFASAGVGALLLFISESGLWIRSRPFRVVFKIISISSSRSPDQIGARARTVKERPRFRNLKAFRILNRYFRRLLCPE